mmetsp:Transcript_8607/g.32374  ORF Transcript_8607/g.32374 Transcript_8607/m.32374 type:complete len:272 (-) Transcript_8607:119-934(-)
MLRRQDLAQPRRGLVESFLQSEHQRVVLGLVLEAPQVDQVLVRKPRNDVTQRVHGFLNLKGPGAVRAMLVKQRGHLPLERNHQRIRLQRREQPRLRRGRRCRRCRRRRRRPGLLVLKLSATHSTMHCGRFGGRMAWEGRGPLAPALRIGTRRRHRHGVGGRVVDHAASGAPRPAVLHVVVCFQKLGLGRCHGGGKGAWEVASDDRHGVVGRTLAGRLLLRRQERVPNAPEQVGRRIVASWVTEELFDARGARQRFPAGARQERARLFDVHA